jgi:hypothetical protein
LLSDAGDKGIEIVYGEEENILYWVEYSSQDKKSLVPARQAQLTNQGKTLSFVHFESPFTSVSTGGRGHPSLVSLVICIITVPILVWSLVEFF